MNKYTLLADGIKERTTMRDAIALYAPDPPPRYNRIPCPVHKGKNYNLCFTDRLYHCFVCGAGGDVISFVEHIFGVDFCTAIEKLNDDFKLELPIKRRMTIREAREAEQRHQEILAERERKKEEERAFNEQYAILCNKLNRLNQNRIKYAPATPYEDWHPAFVEALQNIEHQEYLIDELVANNAAKAR